MPPRIPRRTDHLTSVPNHTLTARRQSQTDTALSLALQLPPALSRSNPHQPDDHFLTTNTIIMLILMEPPDFTPLRNIFLQYLLRLTPPSILLPQRRPLKSRGNSTCLLALPNCSLIIRLPLENVQEHPTLNLHGPSPRLTSLTDRFNRKV